LLALTGVTDASRAAEISPKIAFPTSRVAAFRLPPESLDRSQLGTLSIGAPCNTFFRMLQPHRCSLLTSLILEVDHGRKTTISRTDDYSEEKTAWRAMYLYSA